ncbi:MAG: LysE family transporter [Prolixibacteraceae bacterium]|jgi:threonine/homoserine/homoserine lactone efflux protein|nr:LysE family transporter [Prolixibacteraceae bacterium]
MWFSLFIQGLIVGFLVSVPLGPIGVLVVQRTVNKSRYSGLFSGMGAATSDTFYAIVAGFSLTIIIDFIRQHQMLFQILGTLILLALGFYIFFKNPVRDLKRNRRRGTTHFQDYISSFLITVANPLVIFVFIAVFAGSGLVLNISKPYQALVIIVGIFTGACSWWFTLSGLVSLFRHRINLRVLWWFNKSAGIMVWLFVLITLIVVLVKDVQI